MTPEQMKLMADEVQKAMVDLERLTQVWAGFATSNNPGNGSFQEGLKALIQARHWTQDGVTLLRQMSQEADQKKNLQITPNKKVD